MENIILTRAEREIIRYYVNIGQANMVFSNDIKEAS